MRSIRTPALLAVLVCLSACTAMEPYRAPPPKPVTPPPAAGKSGSGVEIHPVTPPEPEPDQPEPLPPPPSREYTLGPASRALVTQARTQATSKNYSLAASSIERALRIEPNNPLLWLEYGQVRMNEGNYPQAENMARKALATASGDAKTQSAAYRLLADSYRARNRTTEAREAEMKADGLWRN